MNLHKTSTLAFHITKQWSLAALILFTATTGDPADAQDFNPFASDKKPLQQKAAAPIEFQAVTLSGPITDVAVRLTPQATVRIDNPNLGDIYSISIKTDTPGPLSLRLLQLELTADKQVKSQTSLARADINGGQATSLALADTLLPIGPIFIGIGALGDIKGTLRIAVDSRKNAQPFTNKDTLNTADDLFIAELKSSACFSLAGEPVGNDLVVISAPQQRLTVEAFVSGTSPNTGRVADRMREVYERKSPLIIKGLSSEKTSKVCLRGHPNLRPARIKITPSKVIEEPNAQLDFADIPVLKAGGKFSFNTFSTDTDALRIAPAPAGKAHMIRVNGVLGSTVCFRETDNLARNMRECFDDALGVGPILGGDDYILEFSNLITANGVYSVTSELMEFNQKIDRYEPNLPPQYGDNIFATQSPPRPDSTSGRIRLKGSHITRDDKDGYHWADIEDEQLWRIRAIGPGLSGGQITIDGQTSVRLTRPPGTSGRLVADDVFLRPGKAMISLTGAVGDYTVFFRPLGPLPKGFELEDGADGKGQRIVLGKSVSGQLKRGDIDRYTVSLTKPVAVTLNLNPPLGASTKVYMRDVVSTTISHGDLPLKLTIPAGDRALELKPKVASPMDYSLRVDRRNPFAIESNSVTIKQQAETHVRAWSDDLQSVNVPLKYTNTSSETINASLTFETSSSRILATKHSVVLKPGETQLQSVELRTLPDLPPGDYSIMVGLKSHSSQTVGFVDIKLKSTIDAPSVKGARLPALPNEIMGTVNLAHRFRGAKWVNIDVGARSFVKNLDYALDGLLINQENLQPTFRFDRNKTDGLFDLKLGVTKAVPLVGVGFTLVGAWLTPLEEVEIHTSIDGIAFTPWIKGRNDFFNETQYMTGPARLATHVRLVLPAGKDAPTWTRTTEFNVFAQAGNSGLPAQDLLQHGFGAKYHLNKMSAKEQSIMKAKRNRIIAIGKLSGDENNIIQGDPISFRNTMQASIEAIELEWLSAESLRYTPPLSVKIMGANSLLGPWEEIGITEIPDPKTSAVLHYPLPERTSVRFIRFDYEVVKGNYVLLPAYTSVFEQAEGDGYLSVLGEWDKRTRRILSIAPQKDGGTLELNTAPIKGHVQFKHDSDNWTIKTPTDSNTLIFDIQGESGFSPRLSLLQNGAAVEPTSVDYLPARQISRYRFTVIPNQLATLTVSEDKRSTYILIKQSGAMKAFRSRILNGIAELSSNMVLGRDAIALSDMAPEENADWITAPDEVSRKLVDYFKQSNGGGTDAAALTIAAKSMVARTGSKAILLIGDGESGKGDPELETALQASGARLFIAKPPGSVVDMSHSPANDVTQGWAQLGGGDVQYTTSLDDYEMLFSRVSAKLSGPKGYLISATAEQRILKPGFLNVTSAPAVENAERAKRTQLVLLDTSGSMLKRVGDTRRYMIANSALKDYVSAQQDAIASERFDMIGLRIFGGPPNSCETEIVLTPAPLDATAFNIAVNKVTPRNNAKTPIAQALKRAADDISSIDGDVSLLLLTDGEETCGGDPLIEIEALANAGIKTRLDVVSFALSDNINRKPFKAWAKAGGGQYVDAQTDTDLREAIKNTRARQSFRVMKGEQQIIIGQVGIRSEAIPSGSYDVIFDGQEQRHPILIRPEETLEFKTN